MRQPVYQVIHEIPVSQILLLMRQEELVNDPQKAFTFSDEEFIKKIKSLGY